MFFFFFKQKTAYEIYQCDWSSDVCSSDLNLGHSREGIYLEDDIQGFTRIANQFSVAAEQLFLRKKLQTRNRELQKSLKKLRTTQAQLVESERMAAIGEITVTVNHQINNPLTSIIGHAELLRLRLEKLKAEDPKVQDYLETILTQASRIRSITYKLKEIESSLSDNYCDSIRMIPLPD